VDGTRPVRIDTSGGGNVKREQLTFHRERDWRQLFAKSAIGQSDEVAPHLRHG
jgi:hypothetical protein